MATPSLPEDEGVVFYTLLYSGFLAEVDDKGDKKDDDTVDNRNVNL